jgi:hypothetical protein
MPLPKGLQFLQAGWWLIHAIVILLLYSWAYRRGRADEKRDQRKAEKEREKP